MYMCICITMVMPIKGCDTSLPFNNIPRKNIRVEYEVVV